VTGGIDGLRKLSSSYLKFTRDAGLLVDRLTSRGPAGILFLMSAFSPNSTITCSL